MPLKGREEKDNFNKLSQIQGIIHTGGKKKNQTNLPTSFNIQESILGDWSTYIQKVKYENMGEYLMSLGQADVS